MTDARYENAVVRWLEALNSYGAVEAVEAAVSRQIVVRRFGFGAERGQLLQEFTSYDDVAEWLTLTPDKTVFELQGPVEVDEDGLGTCRYKLECVGVEGGGQWRFRLDEDGRLVWLEHAPDDIDQDIDWASRIDWEQVIPAHAKQLNQRTDQPDMTFLPGGGVSIGGRPNKPKDD